MKNIFYVIMYHGETYFKKDGTFGYDKIKARKYKAAANARQIADTLDYSYCCSDLDIIAYDEDWNMINELCDWGNWDEF